jgi:hypothetical protein
MDIVQTLTDLTARRSAATAYDGVLVDEIVAFGEDVLEQRPEEVQLAAALTHHWETSEFANDLDDMMDSAEEILDEVAKVVEA